jgi:predicted nucleic acid-binding protein
MEKKEGLTTIFSVIEYPKALKMKIEILWPKREDYTRAIEIMSGLLEIGKPVPAIDILIASMCVNRNLILNTSDEHFKFIKRVEPELKLKMKE